MKWDFLFLFDVKSICVLKYIKRMFWRRRRKKNQSSIAWHTAMAQLNYPKKKRIEIDDLKPKINEKCVNPMIIRKTNLTQSPNRWTNQKWVDDSYFKRIDNFPLEYTCTEATNSANALLLHFIVMIKIYPHRFQPQKIDQIRSFCFECIQLLVVLNFHRCRSYVITHTHFK